MQTRQLNVQRIQEFTNKLDSTPSTAAPPSYTGKSDIQPLSTSPISNYDPHAVEKEVEVMNMEEHDSRALRKARSEPFNLSAIIPVMPAVQQPAPTISFLACFLAISL